MEPRRFYGFIGLEIEELFGLFEQARVQNEPIACDRIIWRREDEKVPTFYLQGGSHALDSAHYFLGRYRPAGYNLQDTKQGDDLITHIRTRSDSLLGKLISSEVARVVFTGRFHPACQETMYSPIRVGLSEDGGVAARLFYRGRL